MSFITLGPGQNKIRHFQDKKVVHFRHHSLSLLPIVVDYLEGGRWAENRCLAQTLIRPVG
jgi:hypothetical protein